MTRERYKRFTKILATLGPSTFSLQKIEALLDAGMDAVRLNFSHGSAQEHRQMYQWVREVEKKRQHPIAIIADLQGPKLRVGHFKKERVQLKTGALFRLDLSPEAGDENRVALPHSEIFPLFKKGMELLLDDGRLSLQIEKRGADFADTRVIRGGFLSNRKGVTFPGVVFPLDILTPKDHQDLKLALELGVDWVALSFVQRHEDLIQLHQEVKGRAGLLAKIERPSAITDLDLIIAHSDALMIARGDLGVEMTPEAVPILQRRIIKACREAGKPVIVATQMLESMIHAPTPTRAEASDVANAIYEGSDAVMLSGETAIGAHPQEAVEMMGKIIAQVEKDEDFIPALSLLKLPQSNGVSDLLSASAKQVAEGIQAAAIVSYTATGGTALKLSQRRPSVPLLCITEEDHISRRLSLAWGVNCITVPKNQTETGFQRIEATALAYLKEQGIAFCNDQLVITAGQPFGVPGSTNTLRVICVS